MVRTGTDEAVVEGRFFGTFGDDGANGGAGADPEPGERLLARSVARAGRSKAWIDGRMATVGALAEAAGGLIELHGQHQHQALVHVEAQRRALDTFAGIDLSDLRRARSHLHELTDQLAALGGDARARAREVDLLRYQIGEIDAAAYRGCRRGPAPRDRRGPAGRLGRPP